MKEAKTAFSESMNGRTALVVWADDPGCYFVVTITHASGSGTAHPVTIHLQLTHAFEAARLFLEE